MFLLSFEPTTFYLQSKNYSHCVITVIVIKYTFKKHLMIMLSIDGSEGAFFPLQSSQ